MAGELNHAGARLTRFGAWAYGRCALARLRLACGENASQAPPRDSARDDCIYGIKVVITCSCGDGGLRGQRDTAGRGEGGEAAMLYRLICPVLGFLKRFPYLLPASLGLLFLLTFGPLIYAKIYQNWDRNPERGAIGIKDGAYGESYSTPRYLEQGWSANDSLWFYNTSQGSGLMPYDFFLVLQQGDTTELFRSDKNIDKFRYLPQKKTLFNPDALPVGFTKMTYKGKDYVGYTCAACHTGQVNYKGQAVRIDGGPAMADMVGFLTALEDAMRIAQSAEKKKKFIDDVLKLKNDYSSEKRSLTIWKSGPTPYGATTSSTTARSISARTNPVNSNMAMPGWMPSAGFTTEWFNMPSAESSSPRNWHWSSCQAARQLPC
jgi:hypothetical protein